MRVLITGTSSGIGKAIAEKFLKEGFDVTGFDRKEASISQDLYTLSALISATGNSIRRLRLSILSSTTPVCRTRMILISI